MEQFYIPFKIYFKSVFLFQLKLRYYDVGSFFCFVLLKRKMQL